MKAFIVCDELTLRCLEPELDFYSVGVNDNFEDTIEEKRPEFLFVESTWSGRDGAWGGVFHGPNRRVLTELIEAFRSKSIPTVFWNKEDPVHFDQYIDVAAKFDYVFTTHDGSVKDYARKRITAHVLPFAAQLNIHNPIGAKSFEDRINHGCFAGTWWQGQYPERSKQLRYMFDAAIPGLTLYDRSYHHGSSDRRFPEKYKNFVSGNLPYKEMVNAYKSFLYFINANSVQESSTMMSRRVFELMACGTPVLSPRYSANNMLNNCILEADSEEEAVAQISMISHNKGTWDYYSAVGIKEVLTSHTYTHRMKFLLDMIGLRDERIERRLGTLGLIHCLTIEDVKSTIQKLIGDDK